MFCIVVLFDSACACLLFVIFVYSCVFNICFLFFFFKQKTAYEMRISDWSSDVCSSDLLGEIRGLDDHPAAGAAPWRVGLARPQAPEQVYRSEERRVGKECVSTCRSRW